MRRADFVQSLPAGDGHQGSGQGAEVHIGAWLVHDLRKGSLDLAIIIPPPSELPDEVLASQQIVAAVPADHRLAGRRSIAEVSLHGGDYVRDVSLCAAVRRPSRVVWCLRDFIHERARV